MKEIQSNIFKLFLFGLTQRRHYIPILSIYFMSLPNSLANQIGFFTGIWFIASFLTESLSWYMSDVMGHKKALLLWKYFLFISIIVFIIPHYFAVNNFFFFSLGSIFTSLWFSFASWTDKALMHETLEALWKEDKYTKIQSENSAKASIGSMILIISLPFLTEISIVAPFFVMLLNDFFWIIVAHTLFQPEIHKVEKHNRVPFVDIVKMHIKNPIFWIIIMMWIVIWINFSSAPYRPVYLEDLWLPVILIGLSMWLSRLIWFLIAYRIEKIEEILDIKKYAIVMVVLYIVCFFLIYLSDNPYVVLILFAIMAWWFSWTMEIPNSYILKNLKDRKYKATVLSFKSQIHAFSQIILSFFLWIIMWVSYKFGFLVFAITISLILLINLIFINYLFKKYA